MKTKIYRLDFFLLILGMASQGAGMGHNIMTGCDQHQQPGLRETGAQSAVKAAVSSSVASIHSPAQHR